MFCEAFSNARPTSAESRCASSTNSANGRVAQRAASIWSSGGAPAWFKSMRTPNREIRVAVAPDSSANRRNAARQPSSGAKALAKASTEASLSAGVASTTSAPARRKRPPISPCSTVLPLPRGPCRTTSALGARLLPRSASIGATAMISRSRPARCGGRSPLPGRKRLGGNAMRVTVASGRAATPTDGDRANGSARAMHSGPLPPSATSRSRRPTAGALATICA